MCNLSEGIVDRVTERVTKSVTASVTKSVTASVTKSVTASVTKSVTDSVTKSVKRSDAIESVRNLMISTGWSSDTAMAALRIPKELRDEIRMAVSR